MYISARSPRELEAYLARIDRYREDLRMGVVTPEQVARELARAQHGAVTLERAARGYMDSGIARNTRRRVASCLATHWRELAPLELVELGVPKVKAWTERLHGRGLAAGTIAMQWRTLGAVMRFALERGWIAATPWGPWRPRGAHEPEAGRLPREATRTVLELGQLLKTAAAFDVERQARGQLGDVAAKIAAAAFLGLRQGELAGLRWTDVDSEQQTVAIVRQQDDQPTKTRSRRRMRGAPGLFAALELLRSRLQSRGLYDEAGPVFPCERLCIAGPRGYQTVAPYAFRAEVLTTAHLRAIVARAGLPNAERWTPHSLRDSFVTLENAAAGGNLRAVADRSGHQSLASLVRYIRRLERGDLPPPLFTMPAETKRLPPKRTG